MSPADLKDWLSERYYNCIRIAAEKVDEDKASWLEDAEYFKKAIDAVDCLMRNGFQLSADGNLWVPPVNHAAAKYYRMAAMIRQSLDSLN